MVFLYLHLFRVLHPSSLRHQTYVLSTYLLFPFFVKLDFKKLIKYSVAMFIFSLREERKWFRLKRTGSKISVFSFPPLPQCFPFLFHFTPPTPCPSPPECSLFSVECGVKFVILLPTFFTTCRRCIQFSQFFPFFFSFWFLISLVDNCVGSQFYSFPTVIGFFSTFLHLFVFFFIQTPFRLDSGKLSSVNKWWYDKQ